MLSELIGRNLRRPGGLFGRVVAFFMTLVNGPINRWALALLEVQPADRVLEVGFGTGAGIRRLTRLAPSGFVAGVDYSESMVDQARQGLAALIGRGLVEIRQADVTALPYPDGTFDRAITVHCIYFWPSPVAGLQELRRVLKPGGHLLVAFAPKEVLAKHRRSQSFAAYSTADIERLLQRAGFKDLQLKVRGTDLCIIGTRD